MNRRRRLLVVLGAGALHAPLTSFAQPPPSPAGPPGKIWRVGILGLPRRPAPLEAHFYGAVLPGLRDLGYVEGKNLVIEWRFADSDPKRLPALAAELVQWKPDVLISLADDASLAMQQATTTLPIISTGTSDPVALGLVKSLARPGGNITGVTPIIGDLVPKQLEMLLTMTAATVPKVTRVAVLIFPNSPSASTRYQSSVVAAQTLGIRMLPFEAATPDQIDAAFTQMRAQGAGAVLVLQTPFFQQRSQQIAALALKYRLPSMTGSSVNPEAGGLMSYGTNLHEHFRRAAYYVDRIFKGAKPADLPVEQPTRIELVINGWTAKALGLKIPQALLISADRVIE